MAGSSLSKVTAWWKHDTGMLLVRHTRRPSSFPLLEDTRNFGVFDVIMGDTPLSSDTVYSLQLLQGGGQLYLPSIAAQQAVPRLGSPGQFDTSRLLQVRHL